MLERIDKKTDRISIENVNHHSIWLVMAANGIMPSLSADEKERINNTLDDIDRKFNEKANELGRKAVYVDVGSHDFTKEYDKIADQFITGMIEAKKNGSIRVYRKEGDEFDDNAYKDFLQQVWEQVQERERRLAELMRNRKVRAAATISSEGEDNQPATTIS